MPNHDVTDLIAAVYHAYEIIHPGADLEEIERWNVALNSENADSKIMEAYSETCTDCLVKVFEQAEYHDHSPLSLVWIGVAAGYYDAAGQMAKGLEDIRSCLKELANHPSVANDLDDLLAGIG